MLAVPDDQALGVAQRPESGATVKVGTGQSAEVQLSHANRAKNAGTFSQKLRGSITHQGTVAPAPVAPIRMCANRRSEGGGRYGAEPSSKSFRHMHQTTMTLAASAARRGKPGPGRSGEEVTVWLR